MKNDLTWTLRLAREDDVQVLEELIPLSVRKLQAAYYSDEQMNGALGTVFGVDRQLILDETYFVVESEKTIIGCGGWSKRRSLYGSSSARNGTDEMLDPKFDSARVRAFFVHPDYARKGIGSRIMIACEGAIRAAGFKKVELVATLAGEPLYAAFGYLVAERLELPLSNGLKLPGVKMFKRLE
ncbi:MAG: GNAT family N-acetyltransferase [Verrucomicrobiales bacterium]